MTDEQKVLTADQILSAEDSDLRPVQVPEWKDPKTGADTIYLRTMSAKERDAWEADSIENRQKFEGKPLRMQLQNMRARFLARCICDQNGKLLFNEKQIEKFGDKSSLVLSRLWNEASSMNGLNKEDVDELVGNSDGDLSDDSP